MEQLDVNKLKTMDAITLSEFFYTKLLEEDMQAMMIIQYLPKDYDWSSVVDLFAKHEKFFIFFPFFHFLPEDALTDLFQRLMEQNHHPYEMAPFLPQIKKTVIDEIFLKRAREGYDITYLIGYISKDCLHQLANDICNSKINVPITNCIPLMEITDSARVINHITGMSV